MSVDYAIVERAREGLKVPEARRGPEMRGAIELARTRIKPFVETLSRSELTKIRESPALGPDKEAYIQDLLQTLN